MEGGKEKGEKRKEERREGEMRHSSENPEFIAR